MFLGMMFGLVMHYFILYFRIDFPGYQHEKRNLETNVIEQEGDPRLPFWMYVYLLIPASFDFLSTSFCMFGLMYVDVSIYQMLRGGSVVFVALLKEFFIGDSLMRYQWVGIFWNVTAIVLVGLVVYFGEDSKSGSSMLGVLLILMGALVGGLQYSFEEKVMNMENISAPPLLLIGMEGLWGTFICVFLVYPIAYLVPGDDHGSFENAYNTYTMVKNCHDLQIMTIVYILSVFGYNFFAVMVTFLLNSGLLILTLHSHTVLTLHSHTLVKLHSLTVLTLHAILGSMARLIGQFQTGYCLGLRSNDLLLYIIQLWRAMDQL